MLDERGGWVRLALPGGDEGWMEKMLRVAAITAYVWLAGGLIVYAARGG